MIFKRLLNTKWRKEKHASQSSATEPASLSAQATAAPDPGARRQACKQLTDLALLQRISQQDADAGVRDFAIARLRNLLCADLTQAPDLTARLALLTNMDDDDNLIHYLALNSPQPELRRIALQRVQQPRILAEGALRDSVAALRLAAVERLQDKDELERVARLVAKKDKSVYRLARQKLKQINEQELAPARQRAKAENLCENAEKLVRRSLWAQDKAAFDHLDKQWQELDPEVPSDLVARFADLKTRFMDGYQSYRQDNLARLQEQETLQQRHADKQAVLQELENLLASEEHQTQDLEHALADLTQRWEALDSLPPQQRKLSQAFNQASAALAQRIAQRQAFAERDERLARLLQQAQPWQQGTAPLERKQIGKWIRQGRELATTQPDDSLAKQFEEICARLEKKLGKQLAQAEQKLEKLPQRLRELEQELEQGVLKKATALHQGIQADLTLIDNSGLEHARYASCEQHCRQLTPRLRELQQWRKWGTDQHRLDLCEAMEKWLEQEIPLAELTEQVQQLQARWKHLDQSGSPANEALWQRFHQAANSNYERCRPYLDELAEIKRANLRAREELCQQLEDFLSQVDWNAMDWKKAMRAERETRAAWSELGEVSAKQRRALEKRFRAAMKQLDEHLAAERARNRDFKHNLIKQAQALREAPALEQAIDDIKQLQQQWHTTVPAKRKQENQLWQQFREACDAVFERRREIQQLQRNELAEQAKARRALCAELETLAHNEAASAEALQHQWRALQERWQQSQQAELPRQEENKLQRRWQSAEQALQQRADALRESARREQMERLFAQARLCAELEAAVEAATVADAEHWQTRWSQLPASDDAHATAAIRRRFDAALKATADDASRQAWQNALTDNLAQRSELCLRLEVLSGVASPPEAARERLAFQVNRLSEKLGQGEQDPLDEIPKVERAWCLCGAAPAADMARLETRFSRCRQALCDNAAATANSLEATP
jgi:exonuclease SbcC